MKKRTKRTLIICASALLTLLMLGSFIYPKAAQSYCSNAAMKHSQWTKGGEVYLRVDNGNNNYSPILKKSEFNKMCLEDRFGISG